MSKIKNAVRQAYDVIDNNTGKVVGFVTATGLSLAVTAQSAMAALDPAVDTSIAAAQTDGLAMIAKGYGYLGAIGGALVLLGLFYRILRKPAR